MDESTPSRSAAVREPLPYHWALAEFLQSHYADHWEALASEQAEQEHANRVLLELNKTAAPLDETSGRQLQQALNSVKQEFGMESVAVTLWKTSEGAELPVCSVFWVLGEAHIALQESQVTSAPEAESQSLIETALLRWQLWDGWQGRFRVAERLLAALLYCSHRDGLAVQETWNRWNNATDQFAIQSLDPNSRINPAPLQWENMDLLERQRVSEETRRVICRLLTPSWIQTPATLALARRYFPDFSESELSQEIQVSKTSTPFSQEDPQLRDYFCYLLLDFATADRELELRPFVEVVSMARNLNCESRFLEVIAEELNWPSEQLEQLSDKMTSNG